MKTNLKYAIFKTKWGFFGLLAKENSLLRTILPTTNLKDAKKYLLVGMFKDAVEEKGLFPSLQKDVINYYQRTYVDFNKSGFPTNFYGFSNFCKKVFRACKNIPFGQTLTYSQLAEKAGFPKASRAVGTALSKNPLPLLVPCHRVIRADGKIGNFSAPGGGKTKKKMLDLEKRIAAKTQSR